jgi:hypothetical protein
VRLRLVVQDDGIAVDLAQAERWLVAGRVARNCFSNIFINIGTAWSTQS